MFFLQLEIRAKQVLPGSNEGGGRERGQGVGGKNGPNNVCTCEYMNNNNKKTTTSFPLNLVLPLLALVKLLPSG
jgi:hypothetical protein